MKKLLSLILTLALTLTVFGTVAMAEEFSKTVAASDSNSPMEMLWVTQNTTTGAQSISIPALWDSGGNPTVKTNQWILVKFNVGQNLEFATMTFSMRIQLDASKNTKMYVAPLSYTDYKAAADAEEADSTLTTLVKPVSGGANVATKTVSRSTAGTGTGTVTLDATLFNNSAFYHDGYVYLALALADGNDTTPQLGRKSADKTYWKLAITGTVVEAPAYTDFSNAEIAWDNGTCTISNVPATGTAMLIAASFNGTTMVDAQVATIDAAADAVDGVITEPFTGLADGTVKLFLWDSTTLAPAIGVTNAN